MKKAEEYFKYMMSEDDIIELYNESKNDFIEAVKQAQIDAVEYTAKRCAEEANICLRIYNNEIIEEDFGKEVTTEREQEYWGVSKQSILNVADKIKEELNNENE